MDYLETVEGTNAPIDPLRSKQKEDVAKMRASLLACSADMSLAKNAIQNVAVLQIFHQVSRVIRYLDMMDKLEDKLYASIEYTIDKSRVDSTSTWVMLSTIQEKLQKSMIESNKLLEPYLELGNLRLFDLVQPETADTLTGNAALLSPESRDHVRTNAQNVLLQLRSGM